jgi:hypothetical protein
VALLVSGEFFMNRAPTVAQVLAVLAVGASGLILVQARWADILRRVLGACALIISSLLAWRLKQWVEGILPPRGNVSSRGLLNRFLGLGFYLGHGSDSVDSGARRSTLTPAG